MQREERQRIQLETQKVLGDTKSLMEEIDEYINQVDNEEQKLVQLKKAIDFENLSVKTQNDFNKALENIEFAKFKGEKVKKDLTVMQTKATVLEGQIEKVRILNPILEKFLEGLKIIPANSKLYEKISDLNNSKLETTIRTKLNSQLNITEARGIEFNSKSSISQNIVKSNTLKNFIHGKQTHYPPIFCIMET